MDDVKKTTLGDSHNGGRVAVLINDGKREYIQKPRSGDVELAFEKFLKEASALGLNELVPGTVKVLKNRKKSHDVAVVENTPIDSEDKIPLYFKRCGVLLFFAYILGTTDLHCENIIACASYPIAVDLETLLSGKIKKRGAYYRLPCLVESVMRPHLLPNWIMEEERYVDCSGFTGDKMPCSNKPIFNGEKLYAYDYKDELIQGFELAYRLCLDNKESFIKMTEFFTDCTFRQIIRPTQTYSKMIHFLSLFLPESRKNFADGMLRRAYENDIDKDRVVKAEKLLNSEINAVLKEDIPAFYVRGNSVALEDSKGVVFDGFFELSPVENAKNNINKLTPRDLCAQKKIIYQALLAGTPLSKCEKKTHKPAINDLYVMKALGLRLNSDRTLKRIYKTIESNSISSLSSRFMTLNSYSNNLGLESCGYGLYNGLCGIMCAYAALYKKTGDELVLKRIKTYLKKALKRETSFLPIAVSLGLDSGLCGYVNALLHIARLTNDDYFETTAYKLLDKLDATTLEECPGGDLLNGLSSFALILPKIKKEYAYPLAKRILPILVKEECTLTGVAHGYAGLALSIAACQYVTESNKYDKYIIKLLRKENKYYDDSLKNWRDLRFDDKTVYMHGWCSGAPGIGMARKKLMSYTDNSEILEICNEDIKRVKEYFERRHVLRRDTLCCGNSSLLMAASYLGLDAEYIREEVLFRYADEKINVLHIADTCDESLSLMQGIAGVCYALAMYGEEECGEMLL